MKLRGEHIYLRALEQEDIDILYKWENDTEIWKVSNTIAPYSRFVLEQYLLNAHQELQTSKQLRLIVCLNDATPIGTIDLFEFDPQHSRAGIGIMIRENAQQKGYATEALKLFIEYSFNVLLVNQLFCNIGSQNEKSLNLFKKMGFEVVGLKKQWNKITQNNFEDEWMLQLLHS